MQQFIILNDNIINFSNMTFDFKKLLYDYKIFKI